MIQRSLKSETRYSNHCLPEDPGSGRTQSRSAAGPRVPLRPTALRSIVRRKPRGCQRLACPLPHLLQLLLLRCRRSINSADPLDFAASALRSSIRVTSSRRSAAAVHVVESGPDASSRPERPAATGSELELAGTCPRICPGFGWPGPHPLRRLARIEPSRRLQHLPEGPRTSASPLSLGA